MPPTTIRMITPRTISPVFMLAVYPPSEVVSRIRLVEGLVAEREVRNDVLEQRVGERPPVEERRVHDLHSMEPPRTVGHHPVQDTAPPAFHEPERGREGWQGSERRGEGAGGGAGQRPARHGGRLPRLRHAH